MIGFYNYTVIITYLGLISSIIGMTQAFDGNFRIAIFCLALSGLCDMFDGKVARTKRDRTEDEKSFGIQIDSLCDMVSFGVFPVLICYLLGVRGVIGILALTYFSTCGLIRLAFFNVLEIKRQKEEGGCNKYYHGLPITSIAVILPVIFLFHFILKDRIFIILLIVMLFLVGTLYILDFRFQKPDNRFLLAMVILVAIAVLATLFLSRFRVKRLPFIHQEPVIEQLIE